MAVLGSHGLTNWVFLEEHTSKMLRGKVLGQVRPSTCQNPLGTY